MIVLYINGATTAFLYRVALIGLEDNVVRDRLRPVPEQKVGERGADRRGVRHAQGLLPKTPLFSTLPTSMFVPSLSW